MDDPKKGPRLLYIVREVVIYERFQLQRFDRKNSYNGFTYGGGRLLEVVIHGSSTVLQCHVRSKYSILNFINMLCVKFYITITSLGGKLKPAVLTKIEVASWFD